MASNAVLREQTLSDQILSLNTHMEELAVAGEWQQVFEILARRNAMLAELEDRERPDALLAARRSTDQIRSMANEAKHAVARKLTDLSRGRKATDSYRSHA